MELGPYLRDLRLRRGHGTIGALSQYAKALGVTISRESLRLFENEQKVPNPESRRILRDILKLDIHQVYQLERLCAEAHLRAKYDLGAITILDHTLANQISNQIASAVQQVLEDTLPVEEAASEEDIETAKQRIEERCKTILDPSAPL